jgi:hypothetical protein
MIMETPMQTPFIEDLEERKETYRHFWQGDNLGRPLVSIFAVRNEPSLLPAVTDDPEKRWLDPGYVIPNGLTLLANTLFLGDSIPYLPVDLGPGSLAAYLGSGVECHPNTVWFHQVMNDLQGDLPVFNDSNLWWQRHFDLIRQAADVGRKKGFYVAIPDLIEGLDTLASLRGSQELVMDLLFDPQNVHRHLANITDLYFRYYDLLYRSTADEDGWSISTYLEPFGPGRTGKIQCDFAALMNPKLFAEFAVPYLERQAARLDYVAYHLDGPGAIFSTSQVSAIEKIRVVQWIPGAGRAPAYDEKWDDRVFDVLIHAGKVVQIIFTPPQDISEDESQALLQEIVAGISRLLKKYKPENFWFIFKYGFPESSVRRVLVPAARDWGVHIFMG